MVMSKEEAEQLEAHVKKLSRIQDGYISLIVMLRILDVYKPKYWSKFIYRRRINNTYISVNKDLPRRFVSTLSRL